MKIILIVFFVVFVSLAIFSAHSNNGNDEDSNVFAEEKHVIITAPVSDTFVVMTDHVRYNVPYHITNGTMENITAHCELSSLVIQINPDGNGELILEVPRELLDNSGGNRVVEEGDNGFFVLLDGEEIEYEENKYDNTRAIMIQFALDSKELEIIGTFLYPEDGIDACKIVHNPPYSYVLPPLKQIEQTTDIHKIMCKETLVLVTKHDQTPACVKPETKQKLIERGWTNTTVNYDITEKDRVVLEMVSKNEVLSKGTGFDLPKDAFTIEDLKELEQKEKELQKIQNDPNRSYEEKQKAGREIHDMQDRLQNPFQTGVPYHLVKILKGKYFVLEEHFSDLRGYVWWTGSSPNDISHTNQALRIGIDSDHFTLSELKHQDKKIREYLGNEMNILYKKSGYITYAQ